MMNNDNFNNETRKIFAKNLKKWIEIKDKDVNWIAKICNVSVQSAYGWIKGNKIPRMDKISIIAKCLNISITDLLEPDNVKYSLNPIQLKLALFGTTDISDDKLNQVLKYAEFIKGE